MTLLASNSTLMRWHRFWQFSTDQLASMRSEVNEGAVKRIKLFHEQERVRRRLPLVREQGSQWRTGCRLYFCAPRPRRLLSVEDERTIATFYLTRQALFAKAFKFGEMVEATAASYLKRFYLRNTCMDYHPKLVMCADLRIDDISLLSDAAHRLTCLFLATKTENSGITIAEFAQKVKTPAKDILDLEFLVSQALNFQYKVHHAHIAARGLFYDLQVRYRLRW
jgi:cyclin H